MVSQLSLPLFSIAQNHHNVHDKKRKKEIITNRKRTIFLGFFFLENLWVVFVRLLLHLWVLATASVVVGPCEVFGTRWLRWCGKVVMVVGCLSSMGCDGEKRKRRKREEEGTRGLVFLLNLIFEMSKMPLHLSCAKHVPQLIPFF